MTKFTTTELSMVLKGDFYSFADKAFQALNPGEKLARNWHLEAIIHHLELCRRGDSKRLIITVPPRSLKSHTASVCFPAFLLGHNPSSKIICASYAQSLAEDFSNKCRIILEEEWYKATFPSTSLSSLKNSASEFATTKHGFRYATSVGGTLTGRGGDYLILDDLHKPDEVGSDIRRESVINWFENTLQSRLNNMNEGRIILVLQRTHEHDIAGHLMEKGGWTHLSLPAIAPHDMEVQIKDNETHAFMEGDLLHEERFSRQTLDRIKRDVGSFIFSAQYQQEPVPAQGNIIPVRAFRSFETRPNKREGDLIVQSWDIASGQKEHNDYSVGMTWLFRFDQYYLLDVIRKKMDFFTLCIEVNKQATEAKSDLVIIEKAGVGIALIDTLRRRSRLNIIESIPTQDKVTRMMPGTADIEAGKVALPKDALWRADFEKECAAFPNSKHDDQVDALSMFLNWARYRSFDDQGFHDLAKLMNLLKKPHSPSEIHTKEDVKKLLWPGK